MKLSVLTALVVVLTIIVSGTPSVSPAKAAEPDASRPAGDPSQPRLEIVDSEHGKAVLVDGELFTEYWTKSGPRPIMYPVVGPSGKRMTRAYPIEPAQEHEETDHPHHRSLWFAQEGVNHVNFWLDTPKSQAGVVEHKEFVEAQADGSTGVIKTRNDWLTPDGKKVAEDERTWRFEVADDYRIIDFKIVLESSDGPLHIEDSKEGTFATRVAGTIKVDAGGHTLNSRGLQDAEAWGKPAAWVDYFGPVDDEIVGITIFSHPSNFRPEPRWHARTYGLLSANPFGERDFPPVDDYQQGGVTFPKDEPLTLRYRVLLHKGDSDEGRVVEHFEQYKAED